jgi:hypothetical protein
MKKFINFISKFHYKVIGQVTGGISYFESHFTIVFYENRFGHRKIELNVYRDHTPDAMRTKEYAEAMA